MLVTLTMNPCLDRTVYVRSFRMNEANAVLHTREDPAGKGINVAVAAQAMGTSTFCIAPAFEQDKKLRAFLQQSGIPYGLVPAKGRLRTNLKILDEEDSVYTELNEKGGPLDAECVQRLAELTAEQAKKSSVAALCGSLPAGVPENFYANLIRRLHRCKIPVLLDTSGAALRLGAEAVPDFMKPNLEEFSMLCGKSFSSQEEIATAAAEWIRRGVKLLCVSMGNRGALLFSADGAWRAPPLSLNVRGVQGAGDSMAAGICFAYERALSPAETLRTAVAAASASLEREGSLLCTAEGFAAMLSSVQIVSFCASSGQKI